ncbi:MAG TPA: RluA family pseudouridine synthase [Acidimicrobiales bacterium]|nr:RluA family pseudouridine synthase [Acidimicrobiales bacterium]
MKEVVPASLAGERVDRVVAMLTGLARSEVADMVTRGAVHLAGRPVTVRSQRVAAGTEIEVEVPEAGPVTVVGEPDVPVAILYADDDVVVVDKQAGLVVHPGAGNRTGTLVQGLLDRFPELAGVGQPGRPGVVHRLDKGTSGLLVVGRSEAGYQGLVAQLAERRVERRYVALVWGTPEPGQGVIDAPVGRSQRAPTRMAVSSRGRPARTAYEVQRRFEEPVEVSLVACTLETGRTHQIRVHLAAIGHPVVGDPRYGTRPQRLGATRPFLHAERLAFDHPLTGERLVFEAPLPADLEHVLAGLG